MRCPHCDPNNSGSVSLISQTPDNKNPKYRPGEFTGPDGRHYHDARVWTARARCSNGHEFTYTQKVPCTVRSCAFNDLTTRPILDKESAEETLRRGLERARPDEEGE